MALGKPLETQVAAKDPRRMRILIADDDLDQVSTLAMMLTKFGFETDGYYDGVAALRGIEASKPDAVLLDIKMPGLSGYEVAQAVRAKGFQDLLLVAVTALGSADDAVLRARAAGFNYHFMKPVDPLALVALLKHHATGLKRPN
jgi:CheY-like chemotaxis protein